MPIQEVIKFLDTKQRTNEKLERLICDKTGDLVTGGKLQIKVNCINNNGKQKTKLLSFITFYHQLVLLYIKFILLFYCKYC